MPDEEPIEMDTPWRRSLDELQPALSAWALARFAEPVAVLRDLRWCIRTASLVPRESFAS